MKQYIGISRDHSGSMHSLAAAAGHDYNAQVRALKRASEAHKIDTIVSVTECASTVTRVVTNSNIDRLQEIASYHTGGNTALYDSVGDLISTMMTVPDVISPDVSFLIMAITDGEENASRIWRANALGEQIRKLQNTGRWTFTFRVPRGTSSLLIRNLGLHPGNVLEWDQTEKGTYESQVRTETALKSFYTARAAGRTHTDSFYADLQNVTSKEIEAKLVDLSSEITLWPVSTKDHRSEIKPFVEKRLSKGQHYKVGAAFYQLIKSERVQSHKRLMIRDKTTNAIYEGRAARQLLGVPEVGMIRLSPGKFGNYDLFIQSTSVNRKVDQGTNVIYWRSCPDAPTLTWDPASAA